MKRSTTSTSPPPIKKQKHAAGSGSLQIHKYPTVKFVDDAQMKLFSTLSERKALPNKYVDHPSLVLLDIHEELQFKLNKVGWSDLMQMEEPSYKTLTCEFLSSFHVIDENTLSFRIANVQHELIKAALTDIFGWKLVEQQALPSNYSTPFWLKITGFPRDEKYNPRTGLSSAIVSYNLLYFARLMSFTMQGRTKSNNKIQKEDLVLLKYFDSGVPVDWTTLLVNRFLYQAELNRGELVMGGFVTRIAEKLGVFDRNKTSLPVVIGWPTTIDADYLTGMHMFSPHSLLKGLTRVLHAREERSSVQVKTQTSEPKLSLKEQVAELRQSQAELLKGQAELQGRMKQLLQNQEAMAKKIVDMCIFMEQHLSHQSS